MKNAQVDELLYQALETEQGGIEVYETAIRCAVNEDLRDEWQEYLEQTRNHERILQDVCRKLNLDPDVTTPGRELTRDMGSSLVEAMTKALDTGPPEAAQLVAAECVVTAETRDHLNWELLGEIAGTMKGDDAKVLGEAVEQVEDEEDEHLYHSAGWMRELWMESLGLDSVLPPPEERKDVRTAIGAARAKKQRKRAG